MPGSGKSTVGPLLAALLGVPFIDLDAQFEKQTGRTPADAIRRCGERAFRAREHELLSLALSARAAVVAPGGGALCRPRAMAAALEQGHVVWLSASVETLASRLGDAGDHPLLQGGDLAVNLRRTLGRRSRYYRRAHAAVETDGRSPLEVALLVRAALRSRGAGGYAWGGTVPRFRPVPGGWLAVQELGDRSYPVRLAAEGEWQALARLAAETVPGRRLYLLVDATLRPRVVPALLHVLGERAAGVLPLPAGEAAKRIERLPGYLEELLRLGAGRDSALVAVGGGSLLDAAGFAASVYMRGVPHLLVPTTLLAAVDACAGGKTAMDLARAKNIPGTFRQPAGVLVPLPLVEAEVAARRSPDGLAELCKVWLLTWSEELRGLLAEEGGRLHGAGLAAAVRCALEYKLGIVTRDERDVTGVRALLNLGHTFGHAVEAESGYEVSHGRAVAWGLVVAARVSVAQGLADKGLPALVEELCRRLGLWPPPPLPADARRLSALVADKKRAGAKLRLVLLRGVGDPVALYLPVEQVRNLMVRAM